MYVRAYNLRSLAYARSVSCALIYGAEEDRTPDPLHAMQVLSQLSYSPDYLASNGVSLWDSPDYLASNGVSPRDSPDYLASNGVSPWDSPDCLVKLNKYNIQGGACQRRFLVFSNQTLTKNRSPFLTLGRK